MALINCQECGKEVSDKAASCPHCGNPAHQIAVDPVKPGDRKCLKCGYIGTMKTWLGNYNLPQLIAFILLLFYALPGLIFIAWGWGKHKCPRCGALDHSAPAFRTN